MEKVIYLFEGDAKLRDALTKELNREAYTVLAAKDGKSAVQLIGKCLSGEKEAPVPFAFIAESRLEGQAGITIFQLVNAISTHNLHKRPFILLSDDKKDREQSTVVRLKGHYLRKPATQEASGCMALAETLIHLLRTFP
jgi:DNA-binding response OmpR family regulator